MHKQRLEGHLRDVIKTNKNVWYLKLQVNPLAHTTSPADFLIINKQHQAFLIECKECNCKVFTFNRLTQITQLNNFDNFSKNCYSYVLICFWLGSRKKSLYYMIPIDVMQQFIKIVKKKSANMKDFEKYLAAFRIKLDVINNIICDEE
jgi:hypothetical protein